MIVPEGFQTVNPYVFCDDPVVFADFLEQAFGAEEINRTTLDDGTIANLQIQLGSSAIMISQASERYPAMPTAYYLFVENADQSMQAALDAGASLEMEVLDMPYGDRQGGVKDAFGNIWWISQRLTEEPYS